MKWLRWFLVVFLISQSIGTIGPALLSVYATDSTAWKLYTNARYGFSVRYPPDWRLGDPMPDGSGVTFYPPIGKSQIALSGFMNVIEGKSQDGRQTLEEFATAHRRIITELYGKKNTVVKWQKDQATSLAGFPAKQLTFTYQDDQKIEIVEIHMFSLGRNEGRGVRIKLPASSKSTMMPAMTQFLESYQPGRDQNTVSPFTSTPGAPHSQ